MRKRDTRMPGRQRCCCIHLLLLIVQLGISKLCNGDRGATGQMKPSRHRSTPPPGAPSGVHLALGRHPTEMAVAWQTYDNTSSPQMASVVVWGRAADDLTEHASGSSTLFTADRYTGAKDGHGVVDAGRNFTQHTALMTNLQRGTEYFYKVGDPSKNLWSQVFNFRSVASPAELERDEPRLHLIYGDLGSAYAYALCQNCTGSPYCNASTCTSSKGLKADVADPRTDVIIHTGDYAYDLYSPYEGVHGADCACP